MDVPWWVAALGVGALGWLALLALGGALGRWLIRGRRNRVVLVAYLAGCALVGTWGLAGAAPASISQPASVADLVSLLVAFGVFALLGPGFAVFLILWALFGEGHHG